MSMTKELLEQRLAKMLDCSVEELAARGFAVVPCDCGEENCHGWVVVDTDTGD